MKETLKRSELSFLHSFTLTGHFVMLCSHWLILTLSSRVVHFFSNRSQPQYGSLAPTQALKGKKNTAAPPIRRLLLSCHESTQVAPCCGTEEVKLQDEEENTEEGFWKTMFGNMWTDREKMKWRFEEKYQVRPNNEGKSKYGKGEVNKEFCEEIKTWVEQKWTEHKKKRSYLKWWVIFKWQLSTWYKWRWHHRTQRMKKRAESFEETTFYIA